MCFLKLKQRENTQTNRGNKGKEGISFKSIRTIHSLFVYIMDLSCFLDVVELMLFHIRKGNIDFYCGRKEKVLTLLFR